MSAIQPNKIRSVVCSGKGEHNLIEVGEVRWIDDGGDSHLALAGRGLGFRGPQDEKSGSGDAMYKWIVAMCSACHRMHTFSAKDFASRYGWGGPLDISVKP